MEIAQAFVFLAGMALIAGIFYLAFRFTFNRDAENERPQQVSNASRAQSGERLVAAE